MIRMTSITWLAAICGLILLLFMAVRIDWAGEVPPSETLRRETPLQAMETMRFLARENDWKEYWQCFSTRGKAWFIASFYYATALAAFSYPNGRPPEAYEYEQLLNKYGFTKSRMQRNEGESLELFHQRISHYLDGREVEFWKQISSKKQWVVPGDGEIRILKQLDNFVLLALPGELECGVVKVRERWLFDGSEYE